MTRLTQGLRVIAVISASAFSRGRRVLPRARVAASSSSLRPAVARVVPVEPRGPGFGAVPGMGENRAALGAVDHAPGVMGGQAAEPLLVNHGSG
jgi:hypothetical protein